MTRTASLALLVAAAAGLADTARAQLPVAPPPRPIRPDGTADPAPKPEPAAKSEDPAAVVDRIIKNSKDVGDRLEKKDAGTDTRSKQDKILSDIDALINRQDDPPPPKPDDKNKDKNQDKNPDDKKDDKKDDTPKDPMGKDMPPPKGDMPKDKDMGMGKKDMKDPGKHDGMPMEGMNDPPPMPMGGNGRKPRMGDPMGDNKNDQKPDPNKPDDKKQTGGAKDSKDRKTLAGMASGNPNGKPVGKTLLPLDEDVSKDVWGHLPDKLRQQMTQYYNEDVMPKYAELLRLYYSSFAEGDKPVPPKK